MRKTYFIFFFFAFTTMFSQSRKIDSLAVLLKKCKNDSNKVALLIYISQEWVGLYSNFDSSNYYAKSAIKLSESLKPCYKKGLADGYFCLGTAYSIKGNFNEAINSFLTSLKISVSLNDLKKIAACYTGIASVYYKKNKYKEASDYAYRALKLSESIHDTIHIAKNLEYIGCIFGDQSNPIKALEYFKKALILNQAVGARKNAAFNLSSIANVYYNLENDSLCLNYHLQSLKISKDIGYLVLEVQELDNIGALLIDMGKYTQAETYLINAIQILNKVGDSQYIQSVNFDLGRLYFCKKQYRKSRNYLYRALLIADSLNQPNLAKEVYKCLSLLYKESNVSLPDSVNGKYLTNGEMREKALYYYTLYISIGEALFNEENKAALLRQEIKYEFEKKEIISKAEEVKKIAVAKVQFEVKELQLKQSRYLSVGIGIVLLFVIFIGIIFIKQDKIKAEQETVRLEQKLLRSQMNPHFIFNALIAIESFIYRNEPKEAGKYLSGFARLMRLILESSREEYISLEKEITTLKYYLDLQKLRFSNNFDYEIFVSPELSYENVLIPPMLTQPFIENSIEHGLKSIVNGGLVKIAYMKESDWLKVVVTDNGEGIDKNNTEIKDHLSIATTITRERLKLLNRRKNKKIELAVESLADGGTQHGVMVSFSIPLQSAFDKYGR